MKLLFDHNLSPRLVNRLADLFPESTYVYLLGMDQADDQEVWNYAQKVIEKFLALERTTKEPALLSGSFREIKGIKRRYNLPEQLDAYSKVTTQMLEHSSLYRRSTAYFDSGILKLYEEPLQTII
jgi:hypothetical protein